MRRTDVPYNAAFLAGDTDALDIPVKHEDVHEILRRNCNFCIGMILPLDQIR